MHNLRLISVIALLAVGLVRFEAHAATPVTQCGQVVEGSGELVGDLDCSAMPNGAAVNLTGTLYLRGFRITGMRRGIGVSCRTPRCRIVGPGTITGPDDVVYGVLGHMSKRVFLKDVTITDVKGYGVFSHGEVQVTRSTITGCGGATAFEGGNFGGGVVSFSKVRVVGSTISGNTNAGVTGSIVRGSKSTIVNNGTAPDCATTCYNCPCADVVSSMPPKLRKSSCGTSFNPSGVTWGVCSGD